MERAFIYTFLPCFCFPVFSRGMEFTARFAALARRDLLFFEYAGEFCGLAAVMTSEDATINSLFWLGANYHRPVDLPDTMGLSWRESVFRCLRSVQDKSVTVRGSQRPAGHCCLKPTTVCGSLKPRALSSAGSSP